MGLRKSVSLIIYRYASKGLEIFLQSTHNDFDSSHWSLPENVDSQDLISITSSDKIIELDPVSHENGNVTRAWAVEGDWHDIPSFVEMMKNDVKEVGEKIKVNLPENNKGYFFEIKDVIRKVLPHQYEMIKELKEILSDRNSVNNI
jgi:hypothetical protein